MNRIQKTIEIDKEISKQLEISQSNYKENYDNKTERMYYLGQIQMLEYFKTLLAEVKSLQY